MAIMRDDGAQFIRSAQACFNFEGAQAVTGCDARALDVSYRGIRHLICPSCGGGSKLLQDDWIPTRHRIRCLPMMPSRDLFS